MHRWERAAALAGFAVWCVAYVLVTVVVCVILVLPFLVLVALDALVGEPVPVETLAAVPPAPPQQPIAVPVWSRRAA